MPADRSALFEYGFKTTVGLLISLLLMWINALNGKIERNEERLSAMQQPFYTNIENVRNLNSAIDRTEDKLDQLLNLYLKNQ